MILRHQPMARWYCPSGFSLNHNLSPCNLGYPSPHLPFEIPLGGGGGDHFDASPHKKHRKYDAPKVTKNFLWIVLQQVQF